MLPTMIPNIYFYDNSRKCYRITYYEKNYMQTTYYSHDTLIASTHQNYHDNSYTKYHLNPIGPKFTASTQKHIKLMLGFDVKQYVKEWEVSVERERKRNNAPNCHIDTYHEVLYVVSDLFVPFGSMDVRSFAEEFLWATQTFFEESELVEEIENQLEEIGAERGDINSYIWALYWAIENEILGRIENIDKNELIEILKENGWTEMAKHVEHLIEIDEFDNQRDDMIERRRNDQKYNINCCASSFDWEPLDQSFRSENHDQTLCRVFEGAYRQYMDENYDGICDAEHEDDL